MPISKRINNLSITNQHHIFNSHDSNELPAGVYNGNGMQQEPSDHTVYYSEQMHNENNYQANGHHSHEHHQQQHQQQTSHISNNVVMLSDRSNIKYTGLVSFNGLHQSISQHQHSHQQHQPDNMNAIEMENYSPELTADENPFYYNKNKLLFDLHIERVRRNQQANH